MTSKKQWIQIHTVLGCTESGWHESCVLAPCDATRPRLISSTKSSHRHACQWLKALPFSDFHSTLNFHAPQCWDCQPDGGSGTIRSTIILHPHTSPVPVSIH